MKKKLKPPYRELADKQYKDFYKLLVTHSYAEAAAQVGMDAYYSGEGLRTAGYQIYKDIKERGLERVGISGDIIELVEKSIESRKITKGHVHRKEDNNVAEWMKADMLDSSDTKQLVLGGRNKAAVLLHKKFDMINSSRSALKDTSLSQLGTVFGILFDKAQIIQGQATENISVLSKNINGNMTPEESLDAILRMREEEVMKKAQ